jgi:methyl-accepting chemotaxis protein
LIEDSVAKTRQGHDSLQHVSGAMCKMTDSARQIVSLVAGVKTGGVEQTRGIQQIASAMGRIGQLTQSSAAAAQEAASVGEEMSAQASTLGEIVQRVNALVG